MEDASSERRVFLESVCCDFFRFLHLDAGVPAETVLIRQEVAPDPGHVLRRLPSPGLITLATYQERRLKQETSPRRPASLDRIRPARGASSLPPWLGFARDRRPRCLRGSAVGARREESSGASLRQWRARDHGRVLHWRDATPHQPRCHGNLYLRHAVLMRRYRAHPSVAVLLSGRGLPAPRRRCRSSAKRSKA